MTLEHNLYTGGNLYVKSQVKQTVTNMLCYLLYTLQATKNG